MNTNHVTTKAYLLSWALFFTLALTFVSLVLAYYSDSLSLAALPLDIDGDGVPDGDDPMPGNPFFPLWSILFTAIFVMVVEAGSDHGIVANHKSIDGDFYLNEGGIHVDHE